MTARILIFLGLFGLSACETIGGAGQDIQSAGRAVEGTAQQVENDL